MNEEAPKQKANVALDTSSFPPNRFQPSEINGIGSRDDPHSFHRRTNATDCTRMRILSPSYKRRLPTSLSPLGCWIDCSQWPISREDDDSDLSDSEDEGAVSVRELRWSPNPRLHRKSGKSSVSASLDLAATLPKRQRSASDLTSLTR
ncbi:hypothetical protein FisN_40Hu001 [Fistulifera solaris]|jgi:hypothetical protein|uniref:Uncharacterized protein n=1 Tax=Fistulifera solaris TaxID=1519565 RepID=A0A1Z5K7P0_FISSO|nr:hypothetical protein FisN_40Hu001 [Fistulifera solaris]|eukprot:GAX21948.1 hypothetical protein FisN_40Hu001 [Fistulifera solaris]